MKKIIFILLLFVCVKASAQSGAYLMFQDSTIKGQHQIGATKIFDTYGPIYKLWRKPGTDSVFARQGGAWTFYFIDSTGGGGSSAGNYGNLQINRNSSFATPGFDSLGYTTSAGFVAYNKITSTYNGTSGIILSGDLFGSSGTINGISGQGSGTTTVVANDGGDVSIRTGFATAFNVNNAGRVWVITNLTVGGSSAPASATKAFTLYNGTIPSASVTDGVILYAEDVSSSSELKTRDEAGNITTLSPHNFGKIPGGKSEKMAWSFYSERKEEYITADMTKALRTIEQQSKEIEELKEMVNKLMGKSYQKKKPVKLIYTGKTRKP